MGTLQREKMGLFTTFIIEKWAPERLHLDFKGHIAANVSVLCGVVLKCAEMKVSNLVSYRPFCRCSDAYWNLCMSTSPVHYISSDVRWIKMFFFHLWQFLSRQYMFLTRKRFMCSFLSSTHRLRVHRWPEVFQVALVVFTSSYTKLCRHWQSPCCSYR